WRSLKHGQRCRHPSTALWRRDREQLLCWTTYAVSVQHREHAMRVSVAAHESAGLAVAAGDESARRGISITRSDHAVRRHATGRCRLKRRINPTTNARCMESKK